jgi:hypothetical protein
MLQIHGVVRSSVVAVGVALVLAGCGADDSAGVRVVTAPTCGTYSYAGPEGHCYCPAGYTWCYPELPDDTNCCAIPAGCPNGICDPGESSQSCPADCPSGVTCGDGRCDASEAPTTCPADCGEPSTCGNGTCEFNENPTSCPADCAEADPCGDGRCEAPETARSCPADCAGSSSCGDGVCTADESASSCPADCTEAGGCGDGVCTADESASSCPADCTEAGWCGDGVCDATEDASWCPDDCAVPPCTNVACATDRCADYCERLRECGATSEDIAICYDEDCSGWDEFLDEWLDPRVKKADCAAALGSFYSCVAVAECGPLLAGDDMCEREVLGFERECRTVPAYVDVTFDAVLMGPTAPDGCVWDGPFCDAPTPAELAALGDAVAQGVALAAAAGGFPLPASIQSLLARIATLGFGALFDSTEAPDIFGSVRVSDGEGVYGPRSFGVTDNAFRAGLGPTRFARIFFGRAVSATLDLYDEDVAFNDPVGPFVLERKDFLNAWMAGGSAWVLVADRATDPVLQVQMRVVESP